MLVELDVRNVVIVAQATVRPGRGLCAVTGETGAGKSLLLDALELLLGGRGSPRLVGPHGDEAVVTGVFEVEATLLAPLRSELGLLAAGGQVVMRRRLSRAGRSQAWIDDQPVTIAALRSLGRHLVDVRVQHEHLRLLEVARQLELLDRYGGHQDLANDYRRMHQRVCELQSSCERIRSGESESLREADYLRFLLAEIDALAPRPGELDALRREQELLAGAQEWRALAGEGLACLGEDDQAVAVILARLGRRLEDCPDEELRQAGACCVQAQELVREAALACAAALDRLDVDPAALAQVEERLGSWHDLMRKHGGSEAGLLDAWQRMRARLVELDDLEGRQTRLEADLEQALADRLAIGRELVRHRDQAFARLATAWQRELGELGMPKVSLHLIERSGPPGPTGIVQQEIHVTTNPGLPAGPLSEIASGGEAARLTLALAVVLADRDETPVMVFDEVDAGVGGRLGAVMGRKLAELARMRSVLVITHTPQLAAAAARHYVVSKRQRGKRTVAEVVELAAGLRVTELAEMLGGGTAAGQQARALLAEAGS